MLKDILIPDIGGATDVDVIEVLVKVGDKVNVEDSLLTLEGEKATMEIPASDAGTVKEIKLKVGDKVSEGSLVMVMDVSKDAAKSEKETPKKAAEKPAAETAKSVAAPAPSASSGKIHAGPSVRRIARELDIDLTKVKATGPKGRITKEDLVSFIRGGAAGFNVAPAPKIDFSRFGEVKTQKLNKIKKVTARNVHRSWVTVPHVTQFIEADITEMEAYRQAEKKKGTRLTPLVFIMKAVVDALKEYPAFNSSLDEAGENLILKQYFHVGIAVDTPNGLVVPVIRDVDQKDYAQLATELADISTKAREKGLSTKEMSGGCFTISSLGGIGGTAFTPIVNSPEVAILGVSRSETKPVYQDGEFVPRLMLPLSLSYDHRVIDGAEAARFAVFLSEKLEGFKS